MNPKIEKLEKEIEKTKTKIQAINEQKQSLSINVELFGRETPVELNFSEVRKMD